MGDPVQELQQLAQAWDALVEAFTGPSAVPLPAGHPATAVPALVEASMKDLLGPQEWDRLDQALPAPGDLPEFLAGVVEGAAKAALDTVTEDIQLGRDALLLVFEWFDATYDPQIWKPGIDFLVNGTPIPPDVVTDIKRDYPHTDAALTGLVAFDKALRKFAAAFEDDTAAGSGWSKAEALAVEAWSAMGEGFGKLLFDQYEAVIAAAGDAEEQGIIVGRVLGRVVIEAVQIAMGLYALVRAAAKAAAKLTLRVVRQSLHPSELARLRDLAARIEPEIVDAAKNFRRGANQAEQIYDALAGKIAPYRKLKVETGAFNTKVREIYQLKVGEEAMVELQLDAHHIIEARYYRDFADEFRTKFGWASTEDMDCMALHTTWHIRNGDKLSVRYGWKGAEGEVSLTTALMDIVDSKAPPGGYKSLGQLIQSYEEAYRQYSPYLFEQRDLGAWFAWAKAKAL